MPLVYGYLMVSRYATALQAVRCHSAIGMRLSYDILVRYGFAVRHGSSFRMPGISGYRPEARSSVLAVVGPMLGAMRPLLVIGLKPGQVAIPMAACCACGSSR